MNRLRDVLEASAGGDPALPDERETSADLGARVASLSCCEGPWKTRRIKLSA